MTYRMLAINLDDALLSSRNKIHQRTKMALQEAAGKEVEIVLYTRLSYPHALRLAKSLPISTHIIANLGGYITTNLTEPIMEKRIPESAALDILRLLESMDCHIRLFHENFTLANAIRFPNNIASNHKELSNDSTLYTQQYVESITEYILVDAIAPLQINVYFEEDNDRIEAEKAIHSLFKNIAIEHTADGKMIILPKRVSLQNAMYVLMKHFHIQPRQTVIIGCDKADVPLMEMADLGVATANADMHTKNAADWITRSNDGLGVAYAVREIFRKQQPISFLNKMKSK